MKNISAIILVFFVFVIACSKSEEESNEGSSKNVAPSAESQSFTIASTAKTGTVVGTIEATDADEDELSYELVTVDTPFGLEELTGELVLSDEVLFVQADKKSYELTVKVSDGIDSVMVVVKVEVSTSTTPTNPDPTNPDPTNPDPTNPDPTNPDPTNPDPTGISEAEKKRLTDLFVYMAFRKSDSPNTVVKKWNGDMKVFVTGSPTASDRTLIKDFLVTLNGLAADNFNAYLVDDLSEATVEVYFGTYDEVNSNRPNFSLGTKRDNRGGSYATNGGTSKIIKKGEVWINTDLYKQSTIKHEIMHIIGFGHSEDDKSMMHSPSKFLELSADDEFVIKSLYDPSMKAKFNESQARSAVKELFK